MDRLSLVLFLATGPALIGTFVTTVLALGFYGWPAIAMAAGLGAVLTWPVSYFISRWIKRDDPHFNHKRHGTPGLLPDPDAPEI
ncbi:MAG TPA: hypothetical protein VJ906_08255 [Roseovarius sp.]|nr:hypothetical protein [Roseovarius sp.]